MLTRIEIDAFLSMGEDIPVVDVRTPAEYSSGHIPGAINIPLFSNEERAEVGTVYKKVSPDEAYKLGYNIVEPKLDDFVRLSKSAAKEGQLAVYCWRGGMRSRSFAEHIEKNGIPRVYVIEGGYKAFRRYALESFEKPGELYILGGYTGSGKTKILKQMAGMGFQVIDLEGIANHKGSAFGSIGQPEQPENEHFTNLLYWEWRKLDPKKPVWLEDESIHIGRVFIPEVLFQRMREAKVFFLDIPKEVRAELLVKEYVGVDKEPLARAIQKITTRLGGLRTKEALEALEINDFYATAIITLDYYDKFYLKGLNRRDEEQVTIVHSETNNDEFNAGLIMKLLTK